jgi:hypothetical protein
LEVLLHSKTWNFCGIQKDNSAFVSFVAWCCRNHCMSPAGFVVPFSVVSFQFAAVNLIVYFNSVSSAQQHSVSILIDREYRLKQWPIWFGNVSSTPVHTSHTYSL